MPFEPWWQDLRSAARGLSRTRGFAVAAVLTLAIGIAGTTGMFALIQGVLLRPLPVRDQNQLLIAWLELRTSGAGHWPFQPEDIDTLGRSSHLLDAVAGVDYNGVSATASVERGAADTATPTVSQLGVTGRFFDVLGVKPLLGRVLTPADDVAGAENVIVISHGLWQRRYGGDPHILGRTLPLEEHPFRIVGVMPAEFAFPRGAEAWISIAATRAITDPRFAWGVSVDLLARRKPQVTLDQAASELQTLVAQLESSAPASFNNRPRGLTPVVRDFTEIVVGDVRMPLLVLFAAVGLVLLIASANVANLLLMRGEGRRAELAVRIALGASHGRLARQLLAESLLLALVAGAIGLAMAFWSLRPLIAWVPGGLPRLDAVRIDAGVIAFALAVSLMAAMLASLVPILSSALRPGAFDLAMQLRSGGQSRGTVTRTARYGRRLLVIAQVALAMTVVAAGLLTRSLLRLQAVDLGLAANRIVFVSLNLPASNNDDQAHVFAFIDAITARLDATPGIASSTAINTRPYAGTGGWDVAAFTAEGQSADRAVRNPSLNLEGIDPNYFAAFDVPILRGRAFTDHDRHDAPFVAILSEDVAARLWPGEDPIGRRIKTGSPTSKEEWLTIVGVARSTRYRDLAVSRPTLYLPARQFDTPGHTLAVRTTAAAISPANIAALASGAVHAVDPDVQILRVEPFESLLAEPLARPRFSAFLIGLFGAIALLLAGIGLYAVMAAYVRQQYAEIGIRVALGATASDVRRLVIGEALRLAGGGAIIGLATAMITSRVLRGLLYEVQPLDPAALLIAALLLVGVSALACYLPARRAVRIDPVTLLRAE